MDKRERISEIARQMKGQTNVLGETEKNLINNISSFCFERINLWLEPEYGEWFIGIVYKNNILLELVTSTQLPDEKGKFSWSLSNGYKVSNDGNRLYGTDIFIRGEKEMNEFYKMWKNKIEPTYL